MHVLLIGGNRFVGRLLGWRLLAGGHRVTTLNRGRLPDPFGDRVERLVGDRSGPDLERLLGGRRFDAVVDLAAFTGEDGRRAAALFAGSVGHYLVVSTGQVYLVTEGCPRPMREPAPEEAWEAPLMARPADPADLPDWEYGAGKRACEEALAEASRRGFPATRVRIPMVNGPGDYHRRLERYLWRLVDGGPVLLPDGGAPRTRHVDGGEVARFLAGILGREATFGRAYNLAQEEVLPLSGLVERLRDLVGSRSPLVAVPSAGLRAAGLSPKLLSPFDDPWMSLLDPARARDELGFRHAPLDATLRAVAAAFLAHAPSDRPPGLEGREVELRIAAGG